MMYPNRRLPYLPNKISTICWSILFLLVLFGVTSYRAFAQQPSPTPPQRTGRSYETGSPNKKPPPAGPQAPSPVTFSDITAATGISFKHAASPTSQKYLPETMGAGVALFDYDNDGRLDIYFTNGARIQDPMPEGAMPEKSGPEYWNRLYHQKNDGTFEDVTERAGVQGKGYGMGVAAADYDNDGWTDLYVTAYGENTLYHNLGNGTFRDVTKQCGVAGSGWSASAGWFDANRDGRLDLFVTRYLEWDFLRGAIYCGEKRPGYRSYCHPDSFPGITNLLFVQQSDGSVKDVSREAKVADSAGKGLGVAFADFDGDG